MTRYRAVAGEGARRALRRSRVVAENRVYDSEIKAPVLIVFGNHDTLVWTRQGEGEEERNFSGSTDKRTVFIPKAGHFLMFSRTASKFDATISEWLGSRFQ